LKMPSIPILEKGSYWKIPGASIFFKSIQRYAWYAQERKNGGAWYSEKSYFSSQSGNPKK
jgi:hypothetical protein